jgi:diamine N-acetyltransferase
MAGATDSLRLTITSPCGRNWKQILALELEPDQQGFVNSPETVLADWYHGSRQLRPIVFEADGVVVGMASWQPHTFTPHTGWIANVTIDRTLQGQGYGRAAMLSVMDMFREQGFAAAELAYHLDNAVAGLLYLSLGFRPIGFTDENRQIVARLEL